MTRKEWYDQYRESRIERKKNYIPGLNSSTLNEMFKDHYTHILYGKDQVKYDLIEKYENKVSPRLLYEKKLLRAKSKVNGDKMWKDLMQHESPFFKNLPKDKFKRSIFSQGAVLGLEHGVTFTNDHNTLWRKK